MRINRTTLAALCALALPASAFAPAAAAETIGGNPGPQYNYICPHADGGSGLDCFFDAVQHLYTMCRNVHSLEIIEFGYENSQEGVNAAKYESCVDKQKLNMARPYQAALKESRISKQVTEAVQSLHEFWLQALQHIRWNRGETDEQYKERVNVQPYNDFRDKIAGIQTILTVVKERTASPKAARAKGNATPAAEGSKPATKAAPKGSKMKPDAAAGGNPTSAKAPPS